MARSNVVALHRRAKRPAASIYQMRQRELAWILCVTEGYAANLQHALAVNCVTFEESDRHVVEQMLDAAREQADNLLEALKSITKE